MQVRIVTKLNGKTRKTLPMPENVAKKTVDEMRRSEMIPVGAMISYENA